MSGSLPELGRSTRKRAAPARVRERGDGLGEPARPGTNHNPGHRGGCSAQLERDCLLFLHNDDDTDVVQNIGNAGPCYNGVSKLSKNTCR